MTATHAPPRIAVGRRDFFSIICMNSNQPASAKNNMPPANTVPPCQNTYNAMGVATNAVNIRVPSTIPPIFGALSRQNDDRVFENHEWPVEMSSE